MRGVTCVRQAGSVTPSPVHTEETEAQRAEWLGPGRAHRGRSRGPAPQDPGVNAPRGSGGSTSLQGPKLVLWCRTSTVCHRDAAPTSGVGPPRLGSAPRWAPPTPRAALAGPALSPTRPPAGGGSGLRVAAPASVLLPPTHSPGLGSPCRESHAECHSLWPPISWDSGPPSPVSLGAVGGASRGTGPSGAPAERVEGPVGGARRPWGYRRPRPAGGRVSGRTPERGLCTRRRRGHPLPQQAGGGALSRSGLRQIGDPHYARPPTRM